MLKRIESKVDAVIRTLRQDNERKAAGAILSGAVYRTPSPLEFPVVGADLQVHKRYDERALRQGRVLVVVTCDVGGGGGTLDVTLEWSRGTSRSWMDDAVERVLGAAHAREVRKKCEVLLLSGRRGGFIECAEVGMDSARNAYLSNEWLELAVRLEMRRVVDVVAVGTGVEDEQLLGLRFAGGFVGSAPKTAMEDVVRVVDEYHRLCKLALPKFMNVYTVPEEMEEVALAKIRGASELMMKKAWGRLDEKQQAKVVAAMAKSDHSEFISGEDLWHFQEEEDI